MPDSSKTAETISDDAEAARFDELAASNARIAQLFARIVFRERSAAAALENPETLSVKMLSSLGGASSWRGLLKLDEELERESRGFTPPPLWQAWFENVHRNSVERLKGELRELRAIAEPASARPELPGPIYISYAREDAEIAQRIVRQLEVAKIPVWFDQERLAAGDAFRAKYQEMIGKQCAAFLSIISEHSAAREEGYFLYERRRAHERAADFGSRPFYLPVRVDIGEPIVPRNEPQSYAAVRMLNGNLTPDFIEHLRRLQHDFLVEQNDAPVQKRPRARKPAPSKKHR